ncbi:hypothetical protein YC2023_090337 [Brassica napus]
MSSRQRISPTHHGFSDFEPPQTLDMRNENHHFLPLTLVTTIGGLHRLPRKPTADTRVDIDTTRYNSPYPTTDSSGSFIEPGGGAKSFTFKELAAATRNFREVNLLGEGGFGRVYKGRFISCIKI